jgi:hypothetical protein
MVTTMRAGVHEHAGGSPEPPGASLREEGDGDDDGSFRVSVVCDVRYAHGYLYIGDGSFVRRVSVATDELTTVAGDGAGGPTTNGGPATGTAISSACGSAVDATGNLVITDHGTVQVVAAWTGTFHGQNGGFGSCASGGPATAADIGRPTGVAVAASGTVLFAAPPNGVVCAVATGTARFYGQHMTAGDICAIAGGGTQVPGDGGRATNVVLSPNSLAISPAGDLLLTDGIRLRAVSP